MNDEAHVGAVHVDANPAAAIDEPRAARLELLDGDEIVELSIKPSLWFIVIVSMRWVVIVGVLAAGITIATRDGGGLVAAYVVALAVLAAVVRVVVASLQWASRVYVLTNRRVMRLSGVLSVDIADCQLTRVGGTNLRLGAAQRLLGLGSICITPAGEKAEPITWAHVAKAGAIYAKLIRAIKKAQSKQ
jgi:uncharacterized membrane protein YdbT with pleckstrin-like domain